MESFFQRVSGFWPAGRRDLHWHILPTLQEAAALAAPYEGIYRPGLVRVPLQWQHCTLLHAVGLAPEDVDTDALVADARGRLAAVEPFTLTFDRPSVGTVAVEISGWPGRPAADLVDTLTQATLRTGAACRIAPSASPHTSIAYTGAGAEALERAELAAALAGIDGPLSSTVHVDRVHLVAQWHDGAHIQWEQIATVPLGWELTA
ncbi:2'-5' RNA ligase family protein [Streptomyces sp. NPDC085460]|uniref:2'-5' RNA ligase family protein n=1 Tax=Streptomyces sp. NPDC085460 TaxID=3365723 RepID=UPI0037D695D9